MPKAQSAARDKCYHALRHRFTEALTRYLKKNPAFLDDERGQKEAAALLEIMHEILETLDAYEISEKVANEPGTGK